MLLFFVVVLFCLMLECVSRVGVGDGVTGQYPGVTSFCLVLPGRVQRLDSCPCPAKPSCWTQSGCFSYMPQSRLWYRKIGTGVAQLWSEKGRSH